MNSQFDNKNVIESFRILKINLYLFYIIVCLPNIPVLYMTTALRKYAF
jgi:hypothetical protein